MQRWAGRTQRVKRCCLFYPIAISWPSSYSYVFLHIFVQNFFTCYMDHSVCLTGSHSRVLAVRGSALLTYFISAFKSRAEESPYAHFSFKPIISPKVLILLLHFVCSDKNYCSCSLCWSHENLTKAMA